LLASGSGGGHAKGLLKVWDAATGKELHTDDTMSCPVAFSQYGLHLAAVRSDFGLAILDATTWRETRTLPGHTCAIYAMTLSLTPDWARLAAASSDGTVRIWDPTIAGEKTIGEKTKLQHTDMVLTVAFSPHGKYLASGGNDRIIRVWDAATWQPLLDLPDPT